MNYLAEELVERTKQLNNYLGIPSDFWIIGIRNSNDAPDHFDDIFYLMHGEKLMMITSGTTNAGLSILKAGFKRFNKYGAFILESDKIYYNVWKYGLHLGKIPALKQIGAKVTGFRDGNMNDKSEEIGERIEGYFGINFHCASYDWKSKLVKTLIGGWSAGCQVCNNTPEYKKIIETVKNQESVSYCLLKEFSI